MPLFSLITVTRDNLAGLKATAASIQKQDFQDFEWIVIDGNSTDGTQEYLRNTKAKWTSGPDDGIYDAMNKGMARAQGNFFLFLNAGDTLAAGDTLSKIAAKIKDKNPGFVYGDALEGKNRKPARPHTTREWGMFTHHQAMIYAREHETGLFFDTNYQIAADYDFTLRFLDKGVKTLYCGFPVCAFAPGGISQKKALQGRIEQFVIRQRLGFSSVKNIMIFIYQTLSWIFRRIAPGAFWALRSGKPSGNKRAG